MHRVPLKVDAAAWFQRLLKHRFEAGNVAWLPWDLCSLCLHAGSVMPLIRCCCSIWAWQLDAVPVSNLVTGCVGTSDMLRKSSDQTQVLQLCTQLVRGVAGMQTEPSLADRWFSSKCPRRAIRSPTCNTGASSSSPRVTCNTQDLIGHHDYLIIDYLQQRVFDSTS